MLALHAHYNVVSDKVCPRDPGAQIRADSHVTRTAEAYSFENAVVSSKERGK